MGSVIDRFFVWWVALPFLAVAAALVSLALWFGSGSTPLAGAGDASTLPPEERSWLVDDAPATQQAALADLSVDRGEYVAAIAAERACMAEGGVATSEPEWQGNQLVYTFGAAPSRDALTGPQAVYQECHARYGKHVAVAWAIGSSVAP